jgi:hypothetical protein
MIRDKLINKIKQAFTDVTYPSDNALTDSTYGDEPAALIKEFSGKNDWQQLDPQFLDRAPDGLGSALSFFSNNALQFYLPAYLIADICGELRCVDPAYRLCSYLAFPGETKIAKIWGGGTMEERAREEFNRYDAAKVSAIVAYLQWKLESVEEDIEIKEALVNYWLDRDVGND